MTLEFKMVSDAPDSIVLIQIISYFSVIVNTRSLLKRRFCVCVLLFSYMFIYFDVYFPCSLFSDRCSFSPIFVLPN